MTKLDCVGQKVD